MIDRHTLLGMIALCLPLLLVLPGCADSPAAVPPAIQRAQNALTSGGEAMVRDDWQRALGFYQQAADLSASVDDVDTHAVAVLDCAWIAQQRGDYALAKSLLLSLETALLPSDLHDQVQLRLITLALAAGDHQAAHTLLAPYAGGSTPMVLGLRARLAEQEGNVTEEARLAQLLDRDATPTAERANGLRLQARLDLQAGRAQRADEEVLRCIEYDKSLSLSERLIDDLELHAAALTTLGRTDEAAVQTLRAQTIKEGWCHRFMAGWGPKRCASPDLVR